jgi:hypothetical protein
MVRRRRNRNGRHVAGLSRAGHHGAAGLFDQSRTVELTGSVKRWSFVNPHPILLLALTDESGQEAEWDIYFGPAAASALQRRGIAANTFTIGETLTVKGHPALAAGVRGIDIFGPEGVVTRADGTRVP